MAVPMGSFRNMLELYFTRPTFQICSYKLKQTGGSLKDFARFLFRVLFRETALYIYMLYSLVFFLFFFTELFFCWLIVEFAYRFSFLLLFYFILFKSFSYI